MGVALCGRNIGASLATENTEPAFGKVAEPTASQRGDTMKDKLYIVRGKNERHEETGEVLYWSNKYGWCNKADADLFTASEVMRFDLPIGGEWVEFPTGWWHVVAVVHMWPWRYQSWGGDHFSAQLNKEDGITITWPGGMLYTSRYTKRWLGIL